MRVESQTAACRRGKRQTSLRSKAGGEANANTFVTQVRGKRFTRKAAREAKANTFINTCKR